jgi:hypothetical protein
MKKFILKTILMSLPVVVLIFCIEILIQNIPNNYSFKKQYLDKHSKNIETLILGSSHTYSGLNPQYFSNFTFNTAINSQPLSIDWDILKKYNSQFKNLKTIIVPISYLSLYGDSKNMWFQTALKNYPIYFKININHPIKDRFEFFNFSRKAIIKKLYQYYILKKPILTSSESGWNNLESESSYQNLQKIGLEKAKAHSIENIASEKNQEVFNQNVLILDSILNWSKERNIKLVLITTPTFDSYCNNINDYQWNQTVRKCEELAAENSNCIYINLFKDNRFKANDFYDPDHLSTSGAKKLSEIVNQLIKISYQKFNS